MLVTDSSAGGLSRQCLRRCRNCSRRCAHAKADPGGWHAAGAGRARGGVGRAAEPLYYGRNSQVRTALTESRGVQAQSGSRLHAVAAIDRRYTPRSCLVLMPVLVTSNPANQCRPFVRSLVYKRPSVQADSVLRASRAARHRGAPTAQGAPAAAARHAHRREPRLPAARIPRGGAL